MAPSHAYARSPSPTAPPLLRGPSPLGGQSLVAQEDGRIVVADPPRPTSAPPVQPAGPRPPSPGSASLPLRPPVQHARQNSRKELQKIDCQELQQLLNACLSDFLRLVRTVVKIQSRISRHWTVPQRAVRNKMKQLVAELSTNAGYAARYFAAVSHAARKILNFIASCIKDTHGLRDFMATQDLKPITDELRLLHTQWAALERAEGRYGDTLGGATLVLEEAMDPDGWTSTAPLTSPILSLAAAHTSLLSSFQRLSQFFRDLALSEWKPPLLSPSDVKTAAASWREVERAGHVAAGEVTRVVGGKEGIWEQMVAMSFISRAEAEAFIRSLLDSGSSIPPRSPQMPVASPSAPSGAFVGVSAAAGRVFAAAQAARGASLARPVTGGPRGV
ncbi:hypothetical protein JCM10213_004972 [Rhodosporidiobolus nylandii]